MNQFAFEEFQLSKPIIRAIKEVGYQEPTDIQRSTIPEVLANRDVMATAQTGTGKTAAFALPILERLQGQPGGAGIRALILTPTRELALQIETSFRVYGRYLKLRSAVVLGGVAQHSQVEALHKRPDILVATPGRLLDLLNQKQVRLDRVEVLVIDESDRMLDMGFITDVRKIVSHVPTRRQTLLFSATMSAEIAGFAHSMLNNPRRLEATPAASVPQNITQKVLFVDYANKSLLLADILKSADVQRALVFTRTKHRADRVSRNLYSQGISANSIHSNKSQNNRLRALAAFDSGKVAVLVATDILARGIDVDGISHVINYELPEDPENYVHRIGRTARAGALGTALSFCDATEIMNLKEIEKLTRCSLAVVEDHRFHSTAIAALHAPRSDSSAIPGRRVQWRSFGPNGRSGGRARR